MSANALHSMLQITVVNVTLKPRSKSQLGAFEEQIPHSKCSRAPIHAGLKA